MNGRFIDRARAAAMRWKATTSTLPEEARRAAPYIRDGKPVGSYPWCLPPEYAELNLLPEASAETLAYFDAQKVAWHASIGGGPTNHLLSSQVQCVNALGPLAFDGDRLRSAFGSVLDIVEPLEIEPGRLVSFEHIGEIDHLGEVPTGERVRGSMTTSADAAIRFRNSHRDIELALIEWKYTEDYRGRELAPSRGHDRLARYRPLWDDPSRPVHTDVLPYADLFVEPLYQLFRQQLLADLMERAGEGGASAVRVVHVSPPENAGLRQSLNRPSHHQVADDVFDVWRAMLRHPDRFICLDSSVFCDAPADAEYRARYNHGEEVADGHEA